MGIESILAREKQFVTEQDFRELTCANAAQVHTHNNPDFFKGTVVKQAVADELGLKTPLPTASASADVIDLGAFVVK
jgi:hypothetical protein